MVPDETCLQIFGLPQVDSEFDHKVCCGQRTLANMTQILAHWGLPLVVLALWLPCKELGLRLPKEEKLWGAAPEDARPSRMSQP